MKLQKILVMVLILTMLVGMTESYSVGGSHTVQKKDFIKKNPTEDEIIVKACGKKQIHKKKQNTEWNVKAIRARKNQMKKGVAGKIKVAVLDSGVDDLNDIRLADAINLIPGEEDVMPLFWDVSGHGTSVAGIIAAQDDGEGITGIAPDAEIYAAKILDGSNEAPVSRVIQGIYWAIDKKVDIINMSFSTPIDSPALHKAIRDAYDAGILLIGAAGNAGKVEYPAAYDEVIAVGALEPDGTVSEDSAFGKELELVAPGEQICSTGVFGGTMISGGTSMAAPHVAGAAARLWEKDTEVSAEFIRQLLNASANACGNKYQYGNGLIDLSYAEEIYDEFKKNYTEGKTLRVNEREIEENTNEIPVFDDVDYVEGRWTGTDHEALIRGSRLTATDIAILKTGVIYPDRQNSVFYGWIANPEWHGNEAVNYISAYLFATNMATALGQGKSAGSAAVPKGFETIAKRMVADVNTLPWPELLATPSGRNKRLFVWGMAIHTASDAYAHSTYRKVSGGWQLLDHKGATGSKNGYADNKSAIPERYETANMMALLSLNRCIGNSNNVGSAADFNPSDGYKKAGTEWKMGKLKTHMMVHNQTIANALAQYSRD